MGRGVGIDEGYWRVEVGEKGGRMEGPEEGGVVEGPEEGRRNREGREMGGQDK